MALYQPDPRFTGEAAQQHRANFDADQWRGAFQGDLDARGQERQQYAQGLNQAYQQAAAPGLQYGMQDARRQNAFQMARTGMRGGSLDLTGQANVQQQYAQGLAQAAQGGQALQMQQQGQDANWLNAMRMQGLQGGQFEQPFQMQLAHDASQARMGQQAQQAQYTQQNYADAMANQAYRSQLMGGQLSQAGQFINTAGRLGVGPEWMQNYSRVLAGG